MSSRRLSTCLVLVTVAALIAACAPSVQQLQQDRDVPALVEILESDSPADVRAAAAAALGTVGSSEGIDALVAALDDPEATVRASAASALGSLRDMAAVEPLIAALEDRDASVRTAAQGALERLASEASAAMVAHLTETLAEGSTSARVAAAGLLASSGAIEALEALLATADSEEVLVGAAAAEAADALIVELGSAATPVLIGVLSDGGPIARAQAARGLGGYGDVSAVNPLLVALADEDAGVQAAAGLALSAVLGDLSDAEAVEILLAAVSDERSGVGDAARARLAELLVALGPERAVDALTTASANDQWLAVALGVSEAELASATKALGIQLDPIDEIQAVAGAVAGGEPAGAAAAYSSSAGFHPAIVIGDTLFWMDAARTWEPTAVRFLELVVIEDEISWQQIQECLYNGPSIIRYRGVQTVRVLAARDGTLVAERTFQGTDPRACQATEDYYLTELFGEDPDLTGAVEWLESIINPTAP